jgi:hypothetical protein
MKNINVNDLLFTVFGGVVTGDMVAKQIHDTDTSELIGAVIGFVFMTWVYFRDIKKQESKRK